MVILIGKVMINQWILGFSPVQTTRQGRSWSPTVCICNESKTCQHHDWLYPHYTPLYCINFPINFNDIPWTSIPLIFHNIPMIFHSLPMIFPYFRLFGGRTVQRRSAQLLNGLRQVLQLRRGERQTSSFWNPNTWVIHAYIMLIHCLYNAYIMLIQCLYNAYTMLI